MANNKVGNTNNKLNFFTTTLLLIGVMFGSAIFSLSGITILKAGQSVLLTWFIAALLMMMYGLIAAELAGYFPKSGGVYVFPAKAIKGRVGKFLAWISCWGYIIGNFSAISFSAIYVGVYLSASFSWANGLIIPIALLSMLFVFIVNNIKIKNTGKINNFLVLALLLFMIVFIIIAFCNSDKLGVNFDQFFAGGTAGSLGFLSMIPTACVAYSAVVAVAFMASEIKNPKKNIPKSCIVAISIIASIYLFIIFATLLYVSSDYLAANPELQMIPLFAACTKIAAVPWLASLVSISAVLALLTTMLVLVALNARAIKAAADDKILPSIFSKTSKKDQPVFAIVLTVLISAVVCFFPDFVNTVVSLGIIFSAITIVIVVSSLLYARKYSKKPEDIFTLPGGKCIPIIVIVAMCLCNFLNFITSNIMLVLLYTVIILFIGILIFWLSKKLRN